MKMLNKHFPDGIEVAIGDIVFRPLDHDLPALTEAYQESGVPIGLHYGAVIGEDKIITAEKPKGPAIVSFDEFAAGYPVWCIKTNQEPAEVGRRASQTLARASAYNLALSNCEHIATEVGYGHAISAQVLLVRAALGIVTSPAFIIATTGALAGFLLGQVVYERCAQDGLPKLNG